MPKAEALAGL